MARRVKELATNPNDPEFDSWDRHAKAELTATNCPVTSSGSHDMRIYVHKYTHTKE